MARTQWSAALLIGIAAGFTGCTSPARFVQRDQNGGVVAVPQSSFLQWYYRNEAIAYIRENHDPEFTEANIDSEGEVPVGEQVRTDQRNDARMGKDGKPTSDLTGSATVTTTTDLKEYRIKYHVTPKVQTNMTANGKLIPAGAVMSQKQTNPTSNVIPVSGQNPQMPANIQGPAVDPRTGTPTSSFPGANMR